LTPQDPRQIAINAYNKRMDELKKGVCDGTRAASELVPIILKKLVTDKPVCKNMLHKIFKGRHRILRCYKTQCYTRNVR